LVENRRLTYLTSIRRPQWGRSRRNFAEIFGLRELSGPSAIVRRCLCDLRFSHLCRTSTCHRQTDRQTDGRTDGETDTPWQHISC